MTDLRQLAERIVVEATGIDQQTIDHAYYPDGVVDRIERILREHNEGVAEEVVRILRSYDYVDHVEDEAAMFGEILRVLEGGCAVGVSRVCCSCGQKLPQGGHDARNEGKPDAPVHE